MTRYDSHNLQLLKSSTEPSVDSSTCEIPRSLYSNSNVKNFTGKCFFYNQTAEDNVLHQCQTLYLHFCLRKIAHKLGDTTLLAKLSEGDQGVSQKFPISAIMSKLGIL